MVHVKHVGQSKVLYFVFSTSNFKWIQDPIKNILMFF